MSILNSFDKTTEEMLKPSHISQAVENFPETVIITFKQRASDIIASRYEGEIIRTMNTSINIPIYKFYYGAKKLAFYMSLAGGSASAMLLEEVIAKGGKKFIAFGSCGGLDNSVTGNNLIVPIAAYRDEGTSYHYAPPSNYIHLKTAGRLSEIFTELNLPHVKGKTWTTDAIFRETRKNVDERRADGCIAVEMECASLAAVSRFRGVEFYQYLYATDSLDAEVWDQRTMGNLPEDDLERYLKIALEIACRI
jgi:uridine phosphorylase